MYFHCYLMSNTLYTLDICEHMIETKYNEGLQVCIIFRFRPLLLKQILFDLF